MTQIFHKFYSRESKMKYFDKKSVSHRKDSKKTQKQKKTMYYTIKLAFINDKKKK